jgi:histidinol dehydrogenase
MELELDESSPQAHTARETQQITPREMLRMVDLVAVRPQGYERVEESPSKFADANHLKGHGGRSGWLWVLGGSSCQ